MKRSGLADITDAQIAQHTTDKVRQRGEDYYEQGAVVSVVLRGDLLQAEVEGSEDEPYLVSLTLGAGGVTDADCTCPFGAEWDGWCKHIVAALLFCRDSPGEVEERPALKTLLAGLSQPQLQALVQTLVAAAPRLAETVEEWCAGGRGDS